MLGPIYHLQEYDLKSSYTYILRLIVFSPFTPNLLGTLYLH